MSYVGCWYGDINYFACSMKDHKTWPLFMFTSRLPPKRSELLFYSAVIVRFYYYRAIERWSGMFIPIFFESELIES